MKKDENGIPLLPAKRLVIIEKENQDRFSSIRGLDVGSSIFSPNFMFELRVQTFDVSIFK